MGNYKCYMKIMIIYMIGELYIWLWKCLMGVYELCGYYSIIVGIVCVSTVEKVSYQHAGL